MRSQPDLPVRRDRRRRVLPVHAAVPLQRHCRRVGRRHRQRRHHGPGPVLAVTLRRGRAPLRGDLPELRRQAPRLDPVHPRTAGRRGHHPEGGVRQRGHRSRHRRVRAALRVPGGRQLRVERIRGDRRPGGRHPARLDRQALSRGEHPQPGHARGMRGRRIRRARRVDQLRRSRRRTRQHAGAGPFAGYYNDPAATAERLRHGMYRSPRASARRAAHCGRAKRGAPPTVRVLGPAEAPRRTAAAGRGPPPATGRCSRLRGRARATSAHTGSRH